MEFLSRYFATLRAQLAGLTVSQKLLIGLLVVVILGTLFFVVDFSKKPDMVELLPGVHPTPDELAVMTGQLKGRYDFTVNGDQILVPAESRYQILAELGNARALPDDTTAAFSELAKANSFLDTNASAERKWNTARQVVLSKVIRSFPYIAHADVVIAQGQEGGLGRAGQAARAMVKVQLKRAEALTGNQLMAIVETVRGAVAGLKREDVSVSDGNRAYSIPAEGTTTPANLLEFKKSLEDEYTRKLEKQFGHMGEVKVAVNVVPDMSDTRTSSEKYDKAVRATVEETGHDTVTTDGGGAGGAPGVGSNIAAVAAPAAGGGTRTSATSTDTTAKSEARFPKEVTQKSSPPGTVITKMTASISVPRSWFVRMYRRASGGDPKVDPKDQELAETIKGELSKVQTQAVAAIGAENSEHVRVDWFDDTVGPSLPTVAVAEAGFGGWGMGGNSAGLVGQYAKQAVLGAVAFGALMMMLMMVRRAAPAGAGADVDASVFLGGGEGGGRRKRKGETESLEVDDGVIGEAGQGDAVLTGIELDDETLQSRKMVDEVSTMIKENPENAASLVKRWITKGK